MGTLSSKLPALQDYTATITMANQKQVVRAFPDNVVSVSMDDTHMMVGLENGAVGVVLRRNLFEKFVTEPLTTDVNEGAMITAVCCDTFDVRGQSLFYAGDSTGFLHVIGENGVVIDSLKVRDDPIIAIQDVEARKVWVFSDDGRTVVVLNNNKMEKSSLSVTGEHLALRSMSVLIQLDSLAHLELISKQLQIIHTQK